MGDLGKKGWSSLAGNNISSPQGGYDDNFNGNPSASGYQRSNSVVNEKTEDWNWVDQPKSPQSVKS